MKKLKITLLAITLTTFCFSQQLSRNVISSGGNYYTAGGYSNSSTIGESIVTTLTSASNILTQGFQQSFNNPVDPTITIINPLNGDVFLNNNNIGIDFSITDFVVAAGTGDGHIHYYVNGAMTMKYDTLPITLNGLTNGSYQIIIELVDNSHQGFSPIIADTVNFSVNVIYGCTDPLAFNYDATANTDDGSCIAVVNGCTDPLACNWDPAANVDDGSCIVPDGCTDATACNYDALATCDDGSCEFTSCAGCTDPLACGYDATATIDDGSCIVPDGCTDPTQFNYDPNATCDDGSCIAVALGCTDPLAFNYDATANTDDGSCIANHHLYSQSHRS